MKIRPGSIHKPVLYPERSGKLCFKQGEPSLKFYLKSTLTGFLEKELKGERFEAMQQVTKPSLVIQGRVDGPMSGREKMQRFGIFSKDRANMIL